MTYQEALVKAHGNPAIAKYIYEQAMAAEQKQKEETKQAVKEGVVETLNKKDSGSDSSPIKNLSTSPIKNLSTTGKIGVGVSILAVAILATVLVRKWIKNRNK